MRRAPTLWCRVNDLSATPAILDEGLQDWSATVCCHFKPMVDYLGSEVRVVFIQDTHRRREGRAYITTVTHDVANPGWPCRATLIAASPLTEVSPHP